MRLNFGKLFKYLVELCSRKEMFYFYVFIDISNIRFLPCSPIYNLKHLSCHFLKFLKCELVVILLDMKSLELPELMPCFLRYSISAVHVTF